jgi:hypothetical protein
MDNILNALNFTSGDRAYFFDIKKSSNNKFYWNLTESKKTNEGFERHNILVFEENFKEFKNKILELYQESEMLNFSNAYEKWTVEDDEKLEILFCEGKTVKELTQIFQRKPGAIRSRIKKLELKEKYK